MPRMIWSARSGVPISSNKRITCSLAPPCNGPLRVPMADTIAECRSDNVDAVTRAANVEALRPWSACKIKQVSRILAAVGSGSLPVIIYKKLAAWLKSWRGKIGHWLLRMRSHAAITVGIDAVKRNDLWTLASSELSRSSGSYGDNADVAVRNTSIGGVFLGIAIINDKTSYGIWRLSMNFWVKLSSWWALGSRPYHKSAVVSSKVEFLAKSSISRPR